MTAQKNIHRTICR